MAPAVKNLPANAGDTSDAGSIPGLGRSPGGGNGNLYSLHYSCLEKSMDRGVWQATVHGVTKTQTRLSTHTTHVLKRLVFQRTLFCLRFSPLFHIYCNLYDIECKEMLQNSRQMFCIHELALMYIGS